MQITKIFKYKYKDRSKYTNISGILEFGRDTVGCTRASFGGKQAEALAASLANLLLRTYEDEDCHQNDFDNDDNNISTYCSLCI